MSDLKKTFQDMDKTEVGEYRHGRGHFPTEDDGGRANVEVLQALCPNPGATALESVVWAADQIESLQRERDEARSLASYWRYVADPGGIRKPFSETRPFPWERSGE